MLRCSSSQLSAAVADACTDWAVRRSGAAGWKPKLSHLISTQCHQAAPHWSVAASLCPLRKVVVRTNTSLRSNVQCGS